MKTLTADTILDDGVGVVEVPIRERNRVTQGRTLKEAQVMAEDLVRIWVGELGDEELASASVVLNVTGNTNRVQ